MTLRKSIPMTQTTRLITLLLSLAAISCRREQIPNLSLPSITQTGQNTLGFLIDNKVWTNYGRRCTFAGCKDNSVKAICYKEQNGAFILSISADYTILSKTIDQSFTFNTTNIATTGTFSMDSSAGHRVSFIANRYTQYYKEYINISPDKFYLSITKFDTTNKIVSGTFAGVLYNQNNTTDSLTLKDGRFDIQLEYIK